MLQEYANSLFVLTLQMEWAYLLTKFILCRLFVVQIRWPCQAEEDSLVYLILSLSQHWNLYTIYQIHLIDINPIDILWYLRFEGLISFVICFNWSQMFGVSKHVSTAGTYRFTIIL